MKNNINEVQFTTTSSVFTKTLQEDGVPLSMQEKFFPQMFPVSEAKVIIDEKIATQAKCLIEMCARAKPLGVTI